METLNYKKGEVIFYEGAEECWMFSIRSGKIGIYADYTKPGQKLLAELEGDCTFGEMGMIERLPRSATAVALEPSVLYKISDENFADFCKEKPAVFFKILQNTSRRLRELTKDFLSVGASVTEYVNAQEKGEPVSDELMSRMKSIAGKKKK